MQETYVQKDMFAIEGKPPAGEQAVVPRRRIAEEQQRGRRLDQQVFDFSGVDFSRPEVRQSVARAANILIDAQKRRRAGGV
jgi:hypothetical protein